NAPGSGSRIEELSSHKVTLRRKSSRGAPGLGAMPTQSRGHGTRSKDSGRGETRMKRLTLVALFVLIGASPRPQFATAPRDLASAVPSDEAKTTPAPPRRGETVPWSFTVDLSPGWHAYPTQQPDPAADSFITKITPPKTGDLIFVGTPIDQPNPLKRP